jgi:putative endonuclease
MSHYVYIIESLKSGQWYCGYSTDLDRRLEGHNIGLNKSTRGRGPWKFIFIREFALNTDALVFERYLKQSRNKAYIRTKFAAYFLNGPEVYPDAIGAG